MSPLQIVFGLTVALALADTSIAQSPDLELEAYRKRIEQADQEALIEQWKGLPPAEIENRLRIVSALRASVRHIDGRQTPDLVPYHVRMQHFFHGYEQGMVREALATRLSKADLALLDRFTRQHRDDLAREAAAYDAAWMAIAAKAQGMSAGDIASAISTETAKTETRQAERYRGVMQQLSNAGRAVVAEFAYVNVRPQVSIEDPSLLAAAEPEFYKDQIVKTYEMIRAGLPTAPESGPTVREAETAAAPIGRLGGSPVIKEDIK